MDLNHSNTDMDSRKHGQHLSLAERGAIQALQRQGLSLRAIAAQVGCAHSTIWNELKRGTPERTSPRGAAPKYVAKRAQKIYESHRKNCRKPYKLDNPVYEPFIQWMVAQVRKEHWSLDVCVGKARMMDAFAPLQIPCTKTIYNMLWKNRIPVSVFDVPRALSRKRKRKWNRKNKRILGRSISERPVIVASRQEAGHWEVDTVVGRKRGKESVVFTLLERATDHYLAIKVPGRNSAAILEACMQLREEYGDKFSQVFKTITADNGPEFETLSQMEAYGTKVFFAHPYSSWERPCNERHNGMLREFIPKGTSIEEYTSDDILSFADSLNSRPRRALGYHCPEELFDDFLDKVYALK